MVLGSQLIVYNAAEIALKVGISERVVSTTVIALGTSLPEFATAISAFSKKQYFLDKIMIFCAFCDFFSPTCKTNLLFCYFRYIIQ